MLALDCRAERKYDQVCTKETYAKTFGEVRKVKGIEQLILLLGVPIGMSHAYHSSSPSLSRRLADNQPTRECRSSSTSSERSGILSMSSLERGHSV